MAHLSSKVEPTVRILIHDKLAQECIEKRARISPLQNDGSGGRSYMIPQGLIDLLFRFAEESLRLYSEQ